MNSELIIAAILGVVEGLTEFLPISSTGHMILVGKALSFEGPKAETFEIVIQLGAILAVVFLYHRRLFGLLDFSQSTSGFRGIPGLVKMAVACAPAVVVGLLFHKTIKEHLFAPLPVACALVVGGIAMIALERFPRANQIQELDQISYLQAFQIGVAQCFALWPGMSRSGSMIVGGLFFGLSRSVAAEFSFLVAVPMMIMAATYELYKSRELLSMADLPMFTVGFVVSFIFAMIAIRFFIGLLRVGTLVPYGIYRIILGVVVLVVLM